MSVPPSMRCAFPQRAPLWVNYRPRCDGNTYPSVAHDVTPATSSRFYSNEKMPHRPSFAFQVPHSNLGDWIGSLHCRSALHACRGTEMPVGQGKLLFPCTPNSGLQDVFVLVPMTAALYGPQKASPS